MISIDVILVSYNQCHFIAQALDSIFMQKCSAKIRIIVADDASNDGTIEVIKEEAIQSPFDIIYLPTSSNLGITKNYQRAFSACSGDYIAILEGDDYWSSPYHLQQHLDFLNEHRECSMSMNRITWLADQRSEFWQNDWIYPESFYLVNVRKQIEEGNQLGNLSACVLRTSCVKKLPQELFDISIADWMLGVMLAQQGFLGILKDSTSVYRMNSGSKWASRTPQEKLKSILNGIDKYDEFQNGKYHTYWQVYKNKLNEESKKLNKKSKIKKLKWKKDWFPPFIIFLWEFFVPPTLIRRIKKRM